MTKLESRELQVKMGLEQMINQMESLKLNAPTTWLYVWDTIIELHKNNPYPAPKGALQDWLFKGDLDDVFKDLWANCEAIGFTLEYGTEDLIEAVEGWLMDRDYLLSNDEEEDYEDEEDEDEEFEFDPINVIGEGNGSNE